MQTDALIVRFPLTAERRAQLEDVNNRVNSRTAFVPDLAKYGVLERWENASLHDDQGDCEDYALAKRQALRFLGWPLAALDLAVCLDETGAEHAVLIARTDQGDLVLDNRQNRVWRWDQLDAFGYCFQKVTLGGSLRNWHLIAV